MGELPKDGARLQNYEALVAIVDTGNLTRASKKLGRSLQSISRSLSALEEQLGVELVRRTTRQAQPTVAGLAFYQRLNTALGDMAAAETELRDVAGALSGTLSIAASPYFSAKYVVPAIREFAAQNPEMDFDMRISESFAEPVKSGVDLMIRIGGLPPSPLKARKIASLRRVVVASPAYIAQRGRPEVPADLARHACLVRTTAQDAKAWTFQGPNGKVERIPIVGKLDSDNAYVLDHAVLAGLGIGVMPFYHLREAIESGLAEILLADFTLPQLPAHAVLPSTTRTPDRARRFVDLLAQRLKKEVI